MSAECTRKRSATDLPPCAAGKKPWNHEIRSEMCFIAALLGGTIIYRLRRIPLGAKMFSKSSNFTRLCLRDALIKVFRLCWNVFDSIWTSVHEYFRLQLCSSVCRNAPNLWSRETQGNKRSFGKLQLCIFTFCPRKDFSYTFWTSLCYFKCALNTLFTFSLQFAAFLRVLPWS